MSTPDWLSDPKNLQAMRKTGYLGEGGFMMRNNLYGMNVERMTEYDVHELRITDWQSMIGQPIEEALGLKKGQKAILGYSNGNPITAGGQKNYIENVMEMGDGKLRVQVRETVPFGTGTKVDPVKGLIHGVPDDEFARIKEGLNRYHQVPPRCAHTTLPRAGEGTPMQLAQLLMGRDADCSLRLPGESKFAIVPA